MTFFPPDDPIGNSPSITLYTDQDAASRLRDRIAREIAQCIDDGNAGFVDSLMPAYRWLQAIAEPSTHDTKEQT